MDLLDEHVTDDTQPGVASCGEPRFRNKTSKLWDDYKPVCENGVIKRVECRYCHVQLSRPSVSLYQHQEICPGKERLGTSQQQHDAECRYNSYGGINLVAHSDNKRIRSTVWKDFIPLYVEGRIQEAECVHCHKRLSVDKSRGQLNRHSQTCPAPGRTGVNLQKRGFFQSREPSSKSRLQDELSPALTNGMVQIAKYASKFLKGSSGDRVPVDLHVLTSASVEKMDPKEQNTSPGQTAPVISRKFDQETSYQELTRMVILHGYPLSIVEHEEMISFAKSLNPAFNMASRIGIEEYSTILFKKEKDGLQKKIALASHRVSLSACLWTPHASEASVKYLCLTVHFIDSDWKLQRRIIKFGLFQPLTNLDRMIHFSEVTVLDSESGPFNIIWEAIRDWNLDQKLFSLTSVSEIRNDERTSKLKDFLSRRKCLPIGGESYNIACVDDVLNSIVSKGQPMLHLVADILERFIEAHMSTALTQELLIEVVTCEGLKCPQEDAKWWHKIYFGLEVVLHFKKAFPSQDFLSTEDTKTVESAYKILRAFYHAIELVSGPVCSTANRYFNELWIIRTTLEEEACTNHTELACLVWEMQEAFDEYWQNSYLWLSVPVVLDPRFKLTLIEFRLKQAFGTDAAKYVSAVCDTIRELFLEYCSALDKPSVETSNSVVQVGGFCKDSLEDWDKYLYEQTRTQATELKNYLEDGLVPRKDDFDILSWWMSNSTKYPILSIVARDVLAIPASAMHGEVALSCEGPVIHKQWSTLNIKTIEALVCMRDWIK